MLRLRFRPLCRPAVEYWFYVTEEAIAVGCVRVREATTLAVRVQKKMMRVD